MSSIRSFPEHCSSTRDRAAEEWRGKTKVKKLKLRFIIQNSTLQHFNVVN